MPSRILHRVIFDALLVTDGRHEALLLPLGRAFVSEICGFAPPTFARPPRRNLPRCSARPVRIKPASGSNAAELSAERMSRSSSLVLSTAKQSAWALHVLAANDHVWGVSACSPLNRVRRPIAMHAVRSDYPAQADAVPACPYSIRFLALSNLQCSGDAAAIERAKSIA